MLSSSECSGLCYTIHSTLYPAMFSSIDSKTQHQNRLHLIWISASHPVSSYSMYQEKNKASHAHTSRRWNWSWPGQASGRILDAVHTRCASRNAITKYDTYIRLIFGGLYACLSSKQVYFFIHKLSASIIFSSIKSSSFHYVLILTMQVNSASTLKKEFFSNWTSNGHTRY